MVVTSMTNLGFHRAMGELGIERVVTDVGDRYVLAAMREHGLELGGEQSGHVIALVPPDDRRRPGHGGDAAGGPGARRHLAGRGGLARAAFPQKLVNVRADRTRLRDARPSGTRWSARTRRSPRAAPGAIVLRASGTEPLVRVMVEHESADEVERLSSSIAALVDQELGVA